MKIQETPRRTSYGDDNMTDMVFYCIVLLGEYYIVYITIFTKNHTKVLAYN